MTDDGVRVHQSACGRYEDGVSRVETQLVWALDEPDPYLQLLVEDLKFGRHVPPFLPLATVARLRDELTAYLDAVELPWYRAHRERGLTESSRPARPRERVASRLAIPRSTTEAGEVGSVSTNGVPASPVSRSRRSSGT